MGTETGPPREGADRSPATHLTTDLVRSHAAARLLATAGQVAVLDRLAALAARLLAAPSAQVSLLTDRQTVAGAAGVVRAVGASRLEDSLCTVTAAGGAPLSVADTMGDARTRRLPPVTSGAVGTYLGVPLLAADGSAIGAFCVFGPEPRTWLPADVALLTELAGAVMAELELAALSVQYETDRQRWDLALEAAGIGVFGLDLVTGRLEMDERMAGLLGLSAGQGVLTLGQALPRIHPEDRPVVEAAIAAVATSGGDYRAEYRVQLPAGGMRWVSARGSIVGAAPGGATRLLGTAHDVTELRDARDTAARLLETMATGFLAVDRTWRITYVNEEGARIAGRPAQDLVGGDLWTTFPGSRDSAFGRHFELAMANGEPDSVEAYYPQMGRWYDTRVVPDADGLSLYFMDVTDRRADQDRAAAATARVELLAEVGRVLGGATEMDQAIATLAETVVPTLADWSLVTMPDEAGRFHDVGRAHVDPQLRPALDLLADHLMAAVTEEAAMSLVMRTGTPDLRTDYGDTWLGRTLSEESVRELVRPLHPDSVLTVPISGRQATLGALSLVRTRAGHSWTPDEVQAAVEVGRRAGVALDSARLLRAQRRLSETLQDSLLSVPPVRAGLQIEVRYQAAAPDAAVGGDWYDSFVLPDGGTALVVGDVTGHDREAAAAMGQVRAMLRATAFAVGEPPAAVLSALDRAMDGLDIDTLATCVLAVVDEPVGQTPGRVLRWSNAGHPPPVVLRPGGAVEILSHDPDLLLGLDPTSPRSDCRAVLEPGCVVLLYTDGLVERRGESLDVGLLRLKQVLHELRGLPVGPLCDHLLSTLAPTAEDDVVLLAVRLI